jgi:hypothetical protein
MHKWWSHSLERTKGIWHHEASHPQVTHNETDGRTSASRHWHNWEWPIRIVVWAKLYMYFWSSLMLYSSCRNCIRYNAAKPNKELCIRKLNNTDIRFWEYCLHKIHINHTCGLTLNGKRALESWTSDSELLILSLNTESKDGLLENHT